MHYLINIRFSIKYFKQEITVIRIFVSKTAPCLFKDRMGEDRTKKQAWRQRS